MAKRTDSTEPVKGTTPREVVPEFFSTDSGEGVATIDPSPAFIFAHHRLRWTVVDGRVVPDLMRIPFVSGTNGILRSRDGRIRFATAQAMLQDRHFKLIPHSLAPNGRSYLQEVDTLSDGRIVPATITVFETAHAGEASTEWDLSAYADWLEGLVRDGHIAPITQHRASEQLAAARTLLSKAQVKAGQGKATSTDRVEQLTAVVEAWERAVGKKAPKGPKILAKPTTLDLDVGGAS